MPPMLRFQYIDFLWLLLCIPLLIGVYLLWQKVRLRKLRKIGDLHLVQNLMPSYHGQRNHLKFLLKCVAIFFVIVALANLQSGARSEKVQRKGIDVMIAMDVSKSMLAKDVSPNRLEKSKQFVLRL